MRTSGSELTEDCQQRESGSSYAHTEQTEEDRIHASSYRFSGCSGDGDQDTRGQGDGEGFQSLERSQEEEDIK